MSALSAAFVLAIAGCGVSRTIAIEGNYVRAIEVAQEFFNEGYEDPDPKSCAKSFTGYDYQVTETADHYVVTVKRNLERCFIPNAVGAGDGFIRVAKADYSVIDSAFDE